MSTKKYITRTATKEEGYFIYARDAAQDRSLTWEARGMLAYLMSQPADWRINIHDLEQQCGRNKVYTILKQLIEAGYVRQVIQRDEKTKRFISHEYYVQDRPRAISPNLESGDGKEQTRDSTKQDSRVSKDTLTNGENSIEESTNPPTLLAPLEHETDAPAGMEQVDDCCFDDADFGDSDAPTVEDSFEYDFMAEGELGAGGMAADVRADPKHECGGQMKITADGCVCPACGRVWYDESFYNEGKSLTCKKCGVFAYDGNSHDNPDPNMESIMLEWKTELCQPCLTKSLVVQGGILDSITRLGEEIRMAVEPGEAAIKQTFAHIAALTALETFPDEGDDIVWNQRSDYPGWDSGIAPETSDIILKGKDVLGRDYEQVVAVNVGLPETIICPIHGNQPLIHGQCATCYALAQNGKENVRTNSIESTKENSDDWTKGNEGYMPGCGTPDYTQTFYGTTPEIINCARHGTQRFTNDGICPMCRRELDIDSAMSQPDTAPVSRLIDEHTAMKNAIVAAFEWKTEDVTDQMWGIINKASAQLRKVGAKPEDISDLVKFCKGKEWGSNMKPSALPNWFAEWRKSQRQPDEPFLGVEIK